jgi:aryl-alcohol dehydrogenase-like predicted oxidoreductase
VLADPEVLTRLARLRSEGVEVGVTVTGVKQPALLDLASSLRTGDEAPLFQWVQATWNVLLPHAGVALGGARKTGARVILKEAMAGGRLSIRGQHPRWLELSADLGVTPDALALAVALEQPFADVVLSGAATVAQLESNLGAREVRVGALPWQALAEAPEVYWEKRSKLPWT